MCYNTESDIRYVSTLKGYRIKTIEFTEIMFIFLDLVVYLVFYNKF